MAKKYQKVTLPRLEPPVTPVKQEDFYNVPTGTTSNLIMETLGAGENISDLPTRKQQVSHGTKLEVTEAGKLRQIQQNSEKSSITLELADIDKLTGNNKPAKKLFVLALIKANEQAIFNGELGRNYVSFPLQELVDNGFYSRLQSARKGFKDGMDALTSLKVKGRIQKSKKDVSTIDCLELLFTGARIVRGQCTIFFNERIDWGFIAQYFTILPRYYFALSNRASDLLYYIFYIARQHTRDIERRGYFTIGFRAIQSRLQLPGEIGNTDPQRTIKKPIEDAIEELEIKHCEQYGNTEFGLLPVYDDNAPIADYLDNGYLKIELKGSFANMFIDISKDVTKQIETAQKRNERIIERAIAINTAKQLEAK
uniref:Initiator Rep protein domain-containing protein n=1 Tax=uncultured prokaryote TaxID=198431 RepID=A0A0H5PW75_9ZZZZ|nr:hypothetical protein [uncultured prokaryote]